jgi:CheY-like chemotaxis protein
MIRLEDWGRDMALIAVTGWGQKEDRRRSREAGFDYHIVKPVDPGDLVRMLATLDESVRPDQGKGVTRVMNPAPIVDTTSAIL